MVFCYTADERACQRLLGDWANIFIRIGDYSIDWARDNALMLIRSPQGDLASAGLRFNGWGKKYRGWQENADTRDNIAKEMAWCSLSLRIPCSLTPQTINRTLLA